MIIEIIFPLPINKSFYYNKNNDVKKIKIGNLVKAEFRNKIITGLVINIHLDKESDKPLKSIISVYENILFNKELLKSLKFFAKYSCNSYSSMLKLFLSGFKDNTKELPKFLALKNNSKIKPSLTSEQNIVVKKILNLSKKKFSAVLLDGITGSGKTRVYMHILMKYIHKGLQSVILVPEKILTKQWIQELSNDFGIVPEIYHSSISKKEKYRIWLGVHLGKINVVIGTRSALFLPFQNLGLLIIDEEHDSSFKQEEGTILNVRDLGVVRAKNSNSLIILSSATPSLESLYNVKKEKYIRFCLNKRVKDSKLPIIELIDLRNENQKKNKWLTNTLVSEIKKTLKEKKQSLIFINKRGYAPVTLCKNCGYSKNCINCDVALVLHKKKETNAELICHYCNYREAYSNQCQKCGKTDLIPIGPGIERIFEEVKETFADSKIAMLSSDKIKDQKQLNNIINLIFENKIDIIIGTQITAKGHHFPNLKTVGILNIDNLLNSFDLRSAEKSFQLLTQVSGRAGREKTKGKVFIQTFQPKHPVFNAILSDQKDLFLNWEFIQRQKNHQPPFSKFISIVISHKIENVAMRISRQIFIKLRKFFKDIICIGPSPAPQYRLRNKFRWRILIKHDLNYFKQNELKNFLTDIKKDNSLKIDVDPISFF